MKMTNKEPINIDTMKVLDELKAWLNAERKARNEKKAAKKAAALVRESEAIVQARESAVRCTFVLTMCRCFLLTA